MSLKDLPLDKRILIAQKMVSAFFPDKNTCLDCDGLEDCTRSFKALKEHMTEEQKEFGRIVITTFIMGFAKDELGLTETHWSGIESRVK